MPQIHITLGPSVADWFTTERLNTLDSKLTDVVERGFDIEGKKDVTATVMKAGHTRDEADVQIEYRYTIGTDEYKRGKPFNPTRAQQEFVVIRTKMAFYEFISEQKLPNMTLSVWCIPYRDTVFKQFEGSEA